VCSDKYLNPRTPEAKTQLEGTRVGGELGPYSKNMAQKEKTLNHFTHVPTLQLVFSTLPTFAGVHGNWGAVMNKTDRCL
jgi:hypothetical protein